MPLIAWVKAGKPDEEQFKNNLWAKAEYHVGMYVIESAQKYHGTGDIALKYGENRWQTDAALYISPSTDPLAHDKFQVIEGTDRSFINFTDIDRLLQSATHIAAGFQKNFKEIPAIAIGAKHGNLCGAGIGENALEKMLSGDPQAISGGWVLVNFEIGKKEAERLKKHGTEHPRILDGVIAPSVTDEAIDILSRKSGKCRIVINPALAAAELAKLDAHIRFPYVLVGFLTPRPCLWAPLE